MYCVVFCRICILRELRRKIIISCEIFCRMKDYVKDYSRWLHCTMRSSRGKCKIGSLFKFEWPLR